jgi:membrane fusion protein (multidrug efflux system)
MPVVLALGAAALVLASCDRQGQQQTMAEPPAVGVILVEQQKINPFFEFVGKTRAAETVALRARVTGFLEERAFQEGGQVEKDEVLFKIEPQQYRATLAQAEAELAAATASLKRSQVDLARYQELVKSKNVSQQKVDEAQAEVLVQEAAVQTAEANIEKTQLNLDYTEIKAPISGRIDLAAYDVGNLVGPDSGVLATINRMDPIKVAFSIAETWYLDLVNADLETKRRGEDVDTFSHIPYVKLPDGNRYEHPGKFDFFDNKVDEKTGTVLIRAEFPNPDRLLLPGQFVTVLIERREAVDAVMIPQAAVLTDQAGAYVLLVDDQDKVEARRIEIGQRFGPNLVVTAGLEPGERLVLYGLQKVRPGLTVKPELSAAPADPMQAPARAPAEVDGVASDAAADPDADSGRVPASEEVQDAAPADAESRADQHQSAAS